MENIAYVIQEVLSDSSKAWNVQINPNGVGPKFTFGCIDKSQAEKIAAAINEGAVWVQED